MMRTFGYAIINGINTVNMEDNKQNQWAKKKKKKKKREFVCNAKTRNFNMKKGKTCDIINNAMAPLKRVSRVYSVVKAKYTISTIRPIRLIKPINLIKSIRTLRPITMIIFHQNHRIRNRNQNINI